MDTIDVGNERLEKMVAIGSFVEDFTSKMDGVLTIRPDDVILVKIPVEYCDEETAKQIKSMFKTVGFTNKIIIFQDTVQVGILRREDDNGSK